MSKDRQEGEGAFSKVAVGDTIMTRCCVAFGPEDEYNVLCRDRSVNVRGGQLPQVLETRSKWGSRGVGAFHDGGEKRIIKVGIIRNGEDLANVVGLTGVVRKGAVVMERRVMGC